MRDDSCDAGCWKVRADLMLVGVELIDVAGLGSDTQSK
jgi:hypothetical protein